jgi:pantoate--beta-alanine ligase
MLVVHSKQELEEHLAEWRREGDHIALVPTMGNLHTGHLSLVQLAREHAERVVVSIFVNPTQFGENEDFDQYPRTLERDTRRLKTAAADLIFAPDVETMYPFGLKDATTISVPRITENFCGASRPGHFDGVTSVVARLFALVQPDLAVFGQKDYQQQLVIRHMSLDLNLPVAIITGATVREEDGLAMSSRNQYLSEEERSKAPVLFEVLSAVGNDLQNGRRDFESLESESAAKLTEAGFGVDYFSIRRAQNLEIPDRDCDELVVLAAAHLGDARLIDNTVITI